jgi:hypothetical protein
VGSSGKDEDEVGGGTGLEGFWKIWARRDNNFAEGEEEMSEATSDGRSINGRYI